MTWASERGITLTPHGIDIGPRLIADARQVLANGGLFTAAALGHLMHPSITWLALGGGVGMSEMQGAADIRIVPDLATFRILPWAPDTGWFLCDARFQDGRLEQVVPFEPVKS